MYFDVDINFDGLGGAEARRRGFILSAGGVNPSACNSYQNHAFPPLLPIQAVHS
jgi:hypothetical protein